LVLEVDVPVNISMRDRDLGVPVVLVGHQQGFGFGADLVGLRLQGLLDDRHVLKQIVELLLRHHLGHVKPSRSCTRGAGCGGCHGTSAGSRRRASGRRPTPRRNADPSRLRGRERTAASTFPRTRSPRCPARPGGHWCPTGTSAGYGLGPGHPRWPGADEGCRPRPAPWWPGTPRCRRSRDPEGSLRLPGHLGQRGDQPDAGANAEQLPLRVQHLEHARGNSLSQAVGVVAVGLLLKPLGVPHEPQDHLGLNHGYVALVETAIYDPLIEVLDAAPQVTLRVLKTGPDHDDLLGLQLAVEPVLDVVDVCVRHGLLPYCEAIRPAAIRAFTTSATVPVSGST